MKLILILVILGSLIFLDQLVRFGVLFEPGDYLHHEGIAITLFAIAFGILIGSVMKGSSRSPRRG